MNILEAKELILDIESIVQKVDDVLNIKRKIVSFNMEELYNKLLVNNNKDLNGLYDMLEASILTNGKLDCDYDDSVSNELRLTLIDSMVELKSLCIELVDPHFDSYIELFDTTEDKLIKFIFN